MFTQCPHCQTIFRINSAHLKVAEGRVRCSHCHHIFDARQYLMQQLPSSKTSLSKLNFAEDEVLELLKDNTFTGRKSLGAFFFWMFMALLLATLLMGQYLWFTQPERILQHPEARSWLQRFCYVFLCTLPTTRDPQQFQFKDLPSLQAHADNPNIMQIDAIFTNQASFPQPYPILELIFKDINGTAIAQRRFPPEIYLPAEHTQTEMGVQDSVHVRLEIVKTTVIKDNVDINYEFKFI